MLIDTFRKIVLDVHITTTRKHDVKIEPKVVKRSFWLIKVLLGDKVSTMKISGIGAEGWESVYSLNTVNFDRSKRHGTLGWIRNSTTSAISAKA